MTYSQLIEEVLQSYLFFQLDDNEWNRLFQLASSSYSSLPASSLTVVANECERWWYATFGKDMDVNSRDHKFTGQPKRPKLPLNHAEVSKMPKVLIKILGLTGYPWVLKEYTHNQKLCLGNL